MKRVAWLLTAVVIALLVVPAYGRQTSPRQPIVLQSVSFDPLVDGEPARLATTLPTTNPYYIVQFDGPVQAAWLEQLKRLGADILGYLPQYAHVVRLAPADLEKVRQMHAVRWLGAYRPAYKLADSANSRGATTVRELVISAHPGETLATLMALVKAQGGTIVDAAALPSGPVVRARLSGLAVTQLADAPPIAWIEAWQTPQVANAEGRKILGAQEVWQDLGLFGEGQIVAISDSGLSVESNISPDFGIDRIVEAYPPSLMAPFNAACEAKKNWTDLNGHGTHVAGSVLGNGSLSGANPATNQFTNSQAGVAPKAKMVFMAMNTDGSTGIQCIPLNGNYVAFGYNAGARVSSNSWGSNSGGAYTQLDSALDDYLWRTKDYTVLFSAGNSGPTANTIGSPGSAKNVITIGASENNRPDLGSRSDNPLEMASFSSRGPTDDGRVKPDLVAPGTNILSVLGAQANPQFFSAVSPGAPYALSDGTSMATPLAAGATTLLREWLVKNRNVANPSAALIKALLINGAARLGDLPNMDSGWGRLDLKNTISGQYSLFDDRAIGLRTGEVVSYTIQVAGSNNNATLLAEAQQPSLRNAATSGLTLQTQTAASPVLPLNPTALTLSSAIPNSTRPQPIPTADRRTGLTPLGGVAPAPPSTAGASSFAVRPLGATPASLLQEMVYGGNFEDDTWPNAQEIWLGEGLPLRISSSGTFGSLVVADSYSILLGGSPVNDSISYPISFPREIDTTQTTQLSFLFRMGNFDVGFDKFCYAITNASGELFDNGIRQSRGCIEQNPDSAVYIAQINLGSLVNQIKGQSGYLTFYTEGDGNEPHMYAVVDNVSLAVDFPDVTLESVPSVGTPGSTFLLQGRHHPPYGTVLVCSPNCSTQQNVLGAVTADARGEILANINTTATIAPGAYAVATLDTNDRGAAAQFTISGATPTLGVTPDSGPGGTTFGFSGANFSANDSQVQVVINGSPLGVTSSNAAGAVQFTINTRSNTTPGSYTVQVVDSDGRSAQASFEVTITAAGQPTMSVTPASGPAGSSFEFSGSGFDPSTAVSFALDNQAIGQVTSDASGAFQVRLNTTSAIPPGQHTFEAAQGTKQATASFTITGSSTPTDPQPTGTGLYVTLVWTDPPAQTGAGTTLVNNLNLRVEGPGGPYLGNGGTSPDQINNVEAVRIEQPQPGSYTVFVTAASVNANFGAQPYALVATSKQNFNPAGVVGGIGNQPVKRYIALLLR